MTATLTPRNPETIARGITEQVPVVTAAKEFHEEREMELQGAKARERNARENLAKARELLEGLLKELQEVTSP